MQTPLLLVTLAVLAMHIHPSGGSECQSKGEDQDPLLLPEFMRNPPLQRPPRLPRTLHFAVIGPNSSTHKYNLLNVVPAIEMARRRIYDRQLLPGLDIKILSKDSECQSVYSGLASFYFYYENTADVFFGPICDDYTLAPVARYAAKWNIPVLTPGGQAPGFTCKRDYELLTRMLGSYSQVGEFFRHVTSRWNWKTLSLVYENTATSGNSPCYFMMEAVFKALGKVPHHRQIYPTTESKHVLLNVTQEARSKDPSDSSSRPGSNPEVITTSRSD
ncbi:unnamed protein product [Darwinula stevensoni]|uniref:Receptor ligand binding region domain-containing protein n=1 Tax=Darwinula stevensoni TaxID=69355 RepID=A0A7R9A122_9CRUS|nr:unnamed protein product [Darwinula stevensoni]CAG0882507.1 unnamed protein product [Darwinula stevensoni]